MKRNKWKIAFWICLVLLIFTFTFGLINSIDQGLLINDMGIGYSNTKNDLTILIDIYNKTDLSKEQISNLLQQKYSYELWQMEKYSNPIWLSRINLYFENDKLSKLQFRNIND